MSEIAICVVRWIYEQASAILDALKALLLSVVAMIDAYIAVLRAWLLQWDLLAKGEQWLWDQVKGFLEELISMLDALPAGPGAEVCPEFVAYFSDPLAGLLESYLGQLEYLHENVNSDLSFIDELDQAIVYWENTRDDLIAVIDIIDAALYEALMNAAEEVP
jgi:hypothetical protein